MAAAYTKAELPVKKMDAFLLMVNIRAYPDLGSASDIPTEQAKSIGLGNDEFKKIKNIILSELKEFNDFDEEVTPFQNRLFKAYDELASEIGSEASTTSKSDFFEKLTKKVSSE